MGLLAFPGRTVKNDKRPRHANRPVVPCAGCQVPMHSMLPPSKARCHPCRRELKELSSCCVTDCDEQVRAKLLCNVHYQRSRRARSEMAPCAVCGAELQYAGVGPKPWRCQQHRFYVYRQCLTCGVDFLTNRYKQHCSDACNRHTCGHCGREFTGRARRFCTPECCNQARRIANARPLPTWNCEVCGELVHR